jgi:hypothetical protein
MRPVARETGQDAIEQRELHHVDVAALEIEMQHALRPEDERDRGLGLGVSAFLRQIVGLGEALIGLLRPETGGHVHLRGGQVAP